MYIRVAAGLGLLLIVTTIQSQDLPPKPEARKTDDFLASNPVVPLVQEQTSASGPISNGFFSRSLRSHCPTNRNLKRLRGSGSVETKNCGGSQMIS
jgi:hypothetical protein